MPLPPMHALAWVKWAAACVNRELGLIDDAKAVAIAAAALRVAQGDFDDEFPLSVWQTGRQFRVLCSPAHGSASQMRLR